ncbi:MAG TPA: NAD(P)/FAD-dependent oxidoreductase [Acidimicrobiales bacterium]|nr:NAD(P)/FAD-dependent oxidoreductase [Acidimicrobiales bacterium]
MIHYDAIVVGARCAGAPTAMLLAQRGHRVLLVDRTTFPSDTISTLLVNPPGVAAMARWGVLDRVVATGCPAIRTFSFDFGPVVVSGTPDPDDGVSTGYAPRRYILDKILVDAAADAGAEIREGFTLEELLTEDGTVVGIAGHGADGSRVEERARVVVGADGWNSTIARAVGAEKYNELPVLGTAFYTYWSRLPVEGMTTYIRGDRGVALIPTNDDATLVLVGCPYAQAREFRRDVESGYLAAVDRVPELAARLRDATRESRIVAGGVPNFFRKPFGPGWALVGDAAYVKDPITAQGITDALTGAERCAEAIDAALTGTRPYDDAMGDYQRRRDARALPIYEYTTQLARLEPPPDDFVHLLGAIAGNQPAMDGFVSVMSGTRSPAEFFDPDNVGRILARAGATP